MDCKNKLIFEINSVNELTEIASALLRFCENRKTIAFIGEIGAGKTTLITELCDQLKVIDMVSSPTFSIINEYITAQDDKIFHIDLYRLEVPEEALGIGIEDYLDSNYFCFIEWAEIIQGLLDIDDLVTVKIKVQDNNQRHITFLKGEAALNFDE